MPNQDLQEETTTVAQSLSLSLSPGIDVVGCEFEPIGRNGSGIRQSGASFLSRAGSVPSPEHVSRIFAVLLEAVCQFETYKTRPVL